MFRAKLKKWALFNKSILHNLRVSGGAVTRRTVIAIGNEVLKARCPEMLEEND